MLQNVDSGAGSASSKLLQVGESGLVPVEWLVESPKNPRLWFDPEELKDLENLVVRGGQREVITVRALTSAERERYPGAFYMIVSGARRSRALRNTHQTHAEVRVRSYPGEKDEALEAFILNESRVRYSDYELMRYLKYLKELHEWTTNQEVSAHTGIALPTVGKLLNVYALASETVQDRMHPRYPVKKRLRLEVADTFTHFDASVQNTLIEQMPAQLGSAAAQVMWLKKRAEELGVVLQTRKRNPREQRRLVAVLADLVFRKAKALTLVDLTRITENAKEGELAAIVQDLDTAIEKFSELRTKVATAAKLEPSRPETQPSPMPHGSNTAAKVASAPGPASPAAKSSTQVRPAADRRLAIKRPAQTPPLSRMFDWGERTRDPTARPSSPSNGFRSHEITCMVYDQKVERIVLASLSPQQYKAAAAEGRLQYQQEGKPRPEHLPDPDSL